ncbi:sulfate transporter family-domain-containing protein [Mycotypha africana]|uniref:sulfate transporter family-domain-containing protein n=1 Tax=Mycotypha africana TaxID=64632 RepID=UPI002301F650|nr:sulfate transporter family-domain-containing protein [Mycotypha africana]KAI8971566.1 sulfate transporter family-domain-containing protein [Mycotypha africana]
MSTLYVDNPIPSYNESLKNQLRKFPTYTKGYIKSFFPFVNWLPRYNFIWLSGDLTAALTIGVLVIPQSLAYAKIANLPPVYGLYSSFLGVMLYPFLGTSKDISIGASAICSLLVGQVMNKFYASQQYLSGQWTTHDVVVTLTLFSGLIVLVLGVLRLGALFNFISQPAIAGFMAGSGLTIIINQFNKIFGVPHINTSEAPYLVFGKTLINLHHSTVDAAFGISALIYLFTVKYYAQHLMQRYPQYGRWIFFFNSSRSIVVLVFGTLLTFMINHFGYFQQSPISIMGVIPAGLNDIGVPSIRTDILSFFSSDLPGIIVLMVMEHGAIGTSLGKVANYKINMSQEMFATGLANVFGSFFCSYPGTGTFSRSAVMSKSGVRTPLASFFVGVIVLLAIYVCTPAFTYIPSAALAATIAHAVTDLVSGPAVWKKYWDANPFEFVIFASAYIIALFSRIDIAVYVPIALSLLAQLYRSARPRYAVLGRLDLDLELTNSISTNNDEKNQQKSQFDLCVVDSYSDNNQYFPVDHPTLNRFIRPIDEGIICFRPLENIVFENATYIFDKLQEEIESTTRRGRMPAEKLGDRPWNNAEPAGKELEKPLLYSVVLDLSGVHQMDYTGMEALKDAAIAAEGYSGQHVNWYIVTGDSLAVRKYLLFAGFGNQRRDLKRHGSFFSDLRHGVEEGGHRPGIAGCRAATDAQHATETEKKTRAAHNEIVTIEEVHNKHRANFFHLSKGRKISHSQSINCSNNHNNDVYTENDVSDDTQQPKTVDIADEELGDAASEPHDKSSGWCYCNYATNNFENPAENRFVELQDRFPFFFTSLNEAVRAALTKKDEETDIYSLNSVSVISDRESPAFHEEASSST